MAERRLKGLPRLFITATIQEEAPDGEAQLTIQELLAEFPRMPTDYFDRALLNLTRLVKHPADSLIISQAHAPALFSPANYLLMVSQLTDLGYIGLLDPVGGHFQIKSKGWERAQKLNFPGRDSHQAFVAMWFDESCRELFDKGIRPAIEHEEKYTALRIDRKEHNSKIDDEIIAEIRRSRFLVADFAGNRGGVYYEAGFARGLGLPVIMCVPEADLARVHFDTRQYNHIVYTSAEDLRVKLLNRIRATI